MKQFGKIFKFELMNYLANKVFVGVTLVLVALIAVVINFPRITSAFESDTPAEVPEDRPVMLIAGDEAPAMLDAFTAAFGGYEVQVSTDTIDGLTDRIVSGEAECAIVVHDLTSYDYYVNTLSMYDSNRYTASALLQQQYRMNAMMNSGMTAEEAGAVLSVGMDANIITLGKDQMENYFYTYIMIMALYMIIMLYGQMVAANVASEKSSRAMELLITSTKPIGMMFGKVAASCLAGLAQIIAVFGSALLFYNMNLDYWQDNMVVSSIFNMPSDLFIYMQVFFVLGFAIYAFMYSAVGSTVSKLEDINTAVMPITLLFIIAFIVVMISMSTGNVDTLLMKVCSFVPFTSPVAMFTRIAMSTVPVYEIVISIAILIASVAGVGVVSAKIYRVGVLLYGTPPKLGAIIKAVRKA